MRRFRLKALAAAALFLMAELTGLCAETKSGAPDFKEVYELIRTHGAGISQADLDRAAVHGLLTALGPKVSLVTNGAPAAASDTPRISKSTLFESGILYLRVASVAEGLAGEVTGLYQQFNATNRLKGIVMDLRYATGADYAAAAAVADAFASKAQPLLNWGQGMMSSREKTNAIELPVAILVNRETSGAAEALAAVLRTSGAGLILGGRTAGEAMITRNFPLKTGGELRIATSPVALGDGSTVPTTGLKPDIDVVVSADDERAYYADAFYVVRRTNQLAGASGSGATNAPRRRMNEAELVREHREGIDRQTGEPARARPPEPEVPLVNDPALARALDLLKGLAVVRQPRS